MAIASNFPAIRPSLNLDFANARVLDPRITFSRASAATYYDGKTVAKAEENLLARSQEFDAASWNKTRISVAANATTAPDGTVTADFISQVAGQTDSGVVDQLPIMPNDVVTFSIYAKAEAKTFIVLRLAGLNTWFNLSAGVVATVGLGITASIAPLGNGWYRCVVSKNAFGFNQAAVRPADFDNSVTVTDSGGIYIWGAQLEQRSQVTAYTPTTTQPITNYIPVLQTAPAGVPRFDHNPITGESLGLLVEEQRTNICLQSEDIAGSFWQKLGWGVTSNQVTAPDGTLTADLIVGTGGGQINSSPIAAAAGGSYTFSIYLKPANNLGINTTFLIRNSTTSTNIAVVMLNWTSMTVTGPGDIRALANGWYRLYVTATSGISAGDNLLVYPTSANAPGHSFYAWGAQLEAGAFPTSYIKTEASQVTRAADSAAITGTNFSSWYRQDEGTLYAEFKVPSTSSCVAGIGADTFQSNLSFNNQQLVRFSAASPSLTLGAAVDGSNKLSSVIKNGDYAATANGQALSKSSVILAFPPAVTLRIGGAYAGGTAANGTIKRLTYYPKRLTDAQLQALTA